MITFFQIVRLTNKIFDLRFSQKVDKELTSSYANRLNRKILVSSIKFYV